MKEYVVDVSAAKLWEEFIEAFDEGFIRPVGGDGWNGSLDAFNDYFWWPAEHPYRLIIRGWKECAHLLQERKAGNGRPVLEVMDEIFSDNKQAQIFMV